MGNQEIRRAGLLRKLLDSKKADISDDKPEQAKNNEAMDLLKSLLGPQVEQEMTGQNTASVIVVDPPSDSEVNQVTEDFYRKVQKELDKEGFGTACIEEGHGKSSKPEILDKRRQGLMMSLLELILGHK